MDAYENIAIVGFPENAVAPEAKPDVAAQEADDRVVLNRLRLVEPEEENAEPEATDTAFVQPVEPDTDSPFADLMRPDPWERFGLDETRLNEIASAAELFVAEDDVPDFMEAMQTAGVTDEDSFRRFCGFVKRAQEDVAEREAREARLAAVEERLGEREQYGPGSPLENRLANIERMLTQERQAQESAAQFHQEMSRVTNYHGSALQSLADRANRMGLAPPDPEAVANIYAELNLFGADPTVAAQAAFRLLGCDLDARGPEAPHSRRNPSGYVTRRGEIRSAPIVPGRPARSNQSLEDLLADDTGDIESMEDALSAFNEGGA